MHPFLVFCTRTIATTVGGVIALVGIPLIAFAQPSFQLSSKFYEADLGRAKFWDGSHRFGNVFCLSFPRSLDATTLAYAMYNNNTLHFSRATYKDQTALYVATSMVPAGRTNEVEIGRLAAQYQRSVESYPSYFKQSQTTGALGSSLRLTVRNATEGAKDAPFPYVLTTAKRADGQLASLSIHRIFVHGRDRIELAGLRYFNAPIGADHEAEEIADLSAFVEAAADSLQACTVTLANEVR